MMIDLSSWNLKTDEISNFGACRAGQNTSIRDDALNQFIPVLDRHISASWLFRAYFKPKVSIDHLWTDTHSSALSIFVAANREIWNYQIERKYKRAIGQLNDFQSGKTNNRINNNVTI